MAQAGADYPRSPRSGGGTKLKGAHEVASESFIYTFICYRCFTVSVIKIKKINYRATN